MPKTIKKEVDDVHSKYDERTSAARFGVLSSPIDDRVRLIEEDYEQK